MKLLPAGRSDLLDYMRSHIAVWQQDHAAIGLTQQQVDALVAQLAEAEAAFAHARAIRYEAESATQASNDRIGELRASAATALAAIKLFARLQAGSQDGESGVYNAASIARPLKASSLPEPEYVRSASVSVSTQGQPTITWKPPHPRDARERAASSSGLVYSVQRKLPGERTFALVYAGKEPRFTDIALPPGQTQYLVRASRGREQGPWTQAGTIEIGGEVGAVGARSGGVMQLAA